MNIIKEASHDWWANSCWLKMPEKSKASFKYYYKVLYKKALNDNSIPDAEFIIENYPAREQHVMNGRKWSEEEM